MRTAVEKILEQINKVLVGKEDKAELAVITLLAGGHLLLEDVPGVGKTTLANALAKSIDADFGRIQFTPDTLPSDITGVSIYNMKNGAFEYMKGAVMHNIILADEINRTSPKTQASLLEAMEEKQVTVDHVIYPLDKPFMVIATQNPVDFLGTYNLPEAQLDRFMMKLSLGYPTATEEQQMIERKLKGINVEEVKAVATKEEILKMQEEIMNVTVHEDLQKYIVEVVEATRKNEKISLGLSPRATMAMIRAAQASAYIDGRDYVIPDDIIKIMIPVAAHRLVLSVEARVAKQKPEEILASIKKTVKMPR
ncbi:MAG: MoxR family ATPase [Lachnospiraceae bacterium]|nr:MoxR family ATPase [Lachnospiraceae bacterium]